jgi:hypothetical protein
MSHKQATRRQLHESVLCAGNELSCQGLDKRFTAQAEAFMQAMVGQVLCEPAREGLSGQGLLAHFNGVYVVDSTSLDKQHKLMTRLELNSGQVTFDLASTNAHDNRLRLADAELPAGALRLADLGFFDLATLSGYDQAQVCWRTRYKARTHVYLPGSTTPLNLAAFLSQHQQVYCPVWIGRKQQVKAYLVARRVSPQQTQDRQARRAYRAQRKQQPLSASTLALAAWDIYLTNIPDLTVENICALAHARWQIELVFKLWKSFWGLTSVQSTDPIRQRCLFWAKLLAIWLSHALFALDSHPNRSWWQAAQTLRSHATSAIYALVSPHTWHLFLRRLARLLPLTSRMSKRKKRPLSFQALLC